jgi:hypothetical protein
MTHSHAAAAEAAMNFNSFFDLPDFALPKFLFSGKMVI